jgi:PAS domain S-box-containing protein
MTSGSIMRAGVRGTDEVLESILRGAAKILGCNSANFVSVSEKTGEIRVRIGVLADQNSLLSQVEEVLGAALRSTTIRLEDAEGSLVLASWRNRAVYETALLAELVGTAFPAEAVRQASSMIGAHRFICVPVVSGARSHGVIIFEKMGAHAFSPQQREVLLRYAQRIGEIVESDVSVPAPPELQAKLDISLQNQLLQLALAESAPTVLVDPDLRITSCNEAAAHLFGHTADEMLMRNIGSFFWEPRDIRTVLNHQFLFLSNGCYEETAAVRPRDGRAVTCRIRALLLADERYKVVGFVVMLREIRRRPGVQDDEEGVDRLMRQERLATMGEMAAQLAHEIRNPLLAIGATLESLTQDLEMDDAKKGVVMSLMKAISRMDMLLKDYLSLAACHNASVGTVNVSGLLLDVRNLLHGTREVSGKTIALDVPPDLSVRADHEGMKHVFFNVVLNAIEASPPGGVVRCMAAAEDGFVTVTVEDNGPGFGAGAERCFEPFFTTKKNGTGLGLSVCRKIVASHRGAIELSNRDGGGARVSVRIPR